MPVPALRIRTLNDAPPRGAGDFILYWMIAFRRPAWNYSLDRALEWCRDLNKPLLVLEPLRSGYPWASDRLHRFVIDGLKANEGAFADSAERGVRYLPYVEPERGAGSGLVEALAARAAVVVTDDYPCFFLPRMVAATAPRLPVRCEGVDSNGLLPLRAASQSFTMAFHFRRWLQKNLREHLEEDQFPSREPLKNLRLPPAPPLPKEIARRWPAADLDALTSGPAALAKLPIDHQVGLCDTPGGRDAAGKVLATFLKRRLERYLERNDPAADSASGLSPYLHFGHISAHEVFAAAAQREQWSPRELSTKADGKNTGWWGVSPPLESFLDELITWRELGYNFCSQRGDYDQFTSLPDWAKKTLANHAGDPREHLYSRAQFEQAQTHDPLWNAAQRQLVREGRMHNYLRMLWGKKIVEWSATPQAALEVMIELNNKYALDGRDPNSYSGIFWVLGRFDRPWAPERPIFGSIRWMSSDNTAKKLHVKEYLAKYGPQRELFG
ncbi:MAG: deoxyribodipyrimidine photolyase [Pirellulaceae bacterium]|nr:deoxyribodipyrimidine photolyase [Pirellulaceae bacterium]